MVSATSNSPVHFPGRVHVGLDGGGDAEVCSSASCMWYWASEAVVGVLGRVVHAVVVVPEGAGLLEVRVVVVLVLALPQTEPSARTPPGGMVMSLA